MQEAEYRWSSTKKGSILSSFAWGYLASPIGALAVKRIGGVLTFGSGITITAFLTILTPALISWNLNIFLVVRILEGVSEVRT